MALAGPGTGRLILCHNRKGGVGKTTTSVHLSAAFARMGFPTLLIDGDPQANATHALGLAWASDVEAWLAGRPPAVVEARPNLFVLRSDPAHEEWLHSPAAWADSLSARLAPLRAQYLWIFIDTPPSSSGWTNTLLQLADAVLVPVGMTYYSLLGIMQLVDRIPPERLIGLVPVLYDARSRRSPELLDALKRIRGSLVTPPIRQCVQLDRASQAGKTIWEYDARSTAAEDYLALVEWLAERVVEYGTPA